MPKQKRTAKTNTRSDEVAAEDGHDVVGGLKDPTGNTRSTGSAANNTDGITHFQVPFNDKQIACEKHQTTLATKEEPVSLIFTHGAGGGINNPATKDFVTGFASAAKADAVCFQGTMNLVNRTKTFHAVLEDQGRARALGGRSMGSRAAVLTATESEADVRPEALILVSYPLTSEKPAKPKKGANSDVDPRKQNLLDLPESVDVLFVIGSKDRMCDLAALNQVRKDMKTTSWVMEVKNADHGMGFSPKAGVQAVRSKTGGLAAEWLEKRHAKKRYCSVEWSKEDGKVLSSDWIAQQRAAPQKENPKATGEDDELHDEVAEEEGEVLSAKQRTSTRKALAKDLEAENDTAPKKRGRKKH